MDKKVKVVGVPIAVLAIIAGGSYAFDFSQTTTTITSDDDTTIIEGDTIFGIDEEAIANAVLEKVCGLSLIPDEYQEICDEWNTEP